MKDNDSEFLGFMQRLAKGYAYPGHVTMTLIGLFPGKISFRCYPAGMRQNCAVG